MSLLSRFNHFIKTENLFNPDKRLLIAVSGGLDSVVLCELCSRSGFDFAIAHCNFQLRGGESERDEEFVTSLASAYKVPLFKTRFDAAAHAQEHKCSIQLAARELRYAWFAEIREPGVLLLTAHHADDNIETLLMNFFKGTGLAGLHGILPKQDAVVRPLLFAYKEDLRQFATEQNLQWVEDSSNAEDHYTRNFIRLKLLPLLREIYPQVDSNLTSNIQRFREAEFLYRKELSDIFSKMVEMKGEEQHIPVLKLQRHKTAATLLFELMRPLGFTPKQSDEALGLLESASGRFINSATHRILRNRNWLILAPLAPAAATHIPIEDTGVVQFAAGLLSIVKTTLPQASMSTGTDNIQQSLSTIACLDAADIRFPLLLRPWKKGDYFYPLGMLKKKKLARFLIDQKLSAIDKEKVWVLEMNKKVVWVVGMRIDNRFRITEHTKEILKIEWTPSLNS